MWVINFQREGTMFKKRELLRFWTFPFQLSICGVSHVFALRINVVTLSELLQQLIAFFVWFCVVCVCVDFCKWRSLRLNWREEKLLEARCAVRWSTDSKLLPRPPPPNPRFALEWFTPSDSILLSRLITKAMIKRGPTIYHELEFRDRSLEFGEKLLWITFEYQNLAEVKWRCVYYCPN